jgi:hypothetical protein
MIRRRASLDSVDQDAISLRLRPQPTQYPERSTTQTLMQGVSITDMIGSQWVGQGDRRASGSCFEERARPPRVTQWRQPRLPARRLHWRRGILDRSERSHDPLGRKCDDHLGALAQL